MLQKIVASELVEEREKCNFDSEELGLLYIRKEVKEYHRNLVEEMRANPGFENTHKFYEFTPEEV